MNNKPVAWMYVNYDGECEQIEYGECEFEDPDIQLLYTHPVKEQELLDEIAQLKHMNKNWSISEGWLKQENDKLKAELDTANKAYMWMDETYKGVLAELESLKVHPVKELTDEEIEQIASQYLTAHAQFIGAGECHYEGEIEFARAILRKAQEK